MNTVKSHYVYRITNTKINKHYYGSRSCEIHPSEDLGIKYFSSSYDKDFILDQKDNPENFKYKIIKIFQESKDDAINFEIKLHEKFDVAVNENFYNQQKQRKNGFDRTGVKAKKETLEKMSRNRKGKVNVIDENGNKFVVDKKDPRYLSGELVGQTYGKFIATDSNGNRHHISKDDPRYISGELVAVSKGRKVSDETKLKKSKLSKGRIWISNTNLEKTKFIFPNDLDGYLKDGWIVGRKRF